MALASKLCIVMFSLLCACAKSDTGAGYYGAPAMHSDCRIQLAHFCIAKGADPFWISLTQKAGDLHGYIFVVEGVSRADASKRFKALVRDLKTGSTDLKDIPELCRVLDIPSSYCISGPVLSRTFGHAVRYFEAKELKSEEGIRIDVLELQNIAANDLVNLALPCIHTREGAAVCGESLPDCTLSTKWVGCDIRIRQE